MDRRSFIKGAAVAAGMAAATKVARPARALGPANLVLPSHGIETREAGTPVKTVVVVMMENRSVNHYLGWYGAENPAFDAHQAHTYPDLAKPGSTVDTANWGRNGRKNFHGRGFADPSHGWTGGRLERNGGACDGWLHPDTGNDKYTLSYYDGRDVPVWAALTRGYQTYDHWHCSLLAPTQPNRYYMHSGQSAGLKNNVLPPEIAAERPEWALGWDWPTIWSLLDQYGVTGSYYFCNLPQLLFWGPRHLNRTRHITEFYAAAAAGQLPQFCFIDPWYIGPEGIANDDHPHADIRLGQAFLSDVITAFTSSPQYREGAMVITYDEWGGFWDHVNPPRFADDLGTPADPGGDEDFGQSGFRIPTTIISPWTRRPGSVDHTVYEHTSTLKFVAENWGLPFLTTRQRETNSIATAFAGFAHYDPEPVDVSYEAPGHLLLEPTLEKVRKRVPDESVSDTYRLAEMGWFDQFPIKLDHRFEDSFTRSLTKVP